MVLNLDSVSEKETFRSRLNYNLVKIYSKQNNAIVQPETNVVVIKTVICLCHTASI